MVKNCHSKNRTSGSKTPHPQQSLVTGMDAKTPYRWFYMVINCPSILLMRAPAQPDGVAWGHTSLLLYKLPKQTFTFLFYPFSSLVLLDRLHKYGPHMAHTFCIFSMAFSRWSCLRVPRNETQTYWIGLPLPFTSCKSFVSDLVWCLWDDDTYV